MSWHVPDALLDRFAALDETLPAPDVWSVEAHLERCPDCRARLTDSLAPELRTLVDDVHAGLALPAAPQRPRRRLTGGLLISRLLACVAVLVAATGLDLASDSGGTWVLLAAPVLPLLGVAASWSRALDPAYDLTAATPAAGLALLLRRTLVVLTVVVPSALLAGVATGAEGPVTWLLPCLALTAAALALGSVTGLARATGAVAAAWAAGVVLPALAAQGTPAVLEAAWLWGALTVAAAAVVAARRNSYRRVLGG